MNTLLTLCYCLELLGYKEFLYCVMCMFCHLRQVLSYAVLVYSVCDSFHNSGINCDLYMKFDKNYNNY